MQVTGHSSKLVRFKPLCALAESGNLKIVKGDWNEDFLSELEKFTGERSNTRDSKDDQVDAARDAFATLAKSVSIPAVQIPSLTQPSPIVTY